MPEHRLSAEQRRALATLATSGPDGATQAVLSSHGFDASLIAGLVNRGLATITYERVRAGAKDVESRRCGSRKRGGMRLGRFDRCDGGLPA